MSRARVRTMRERGEARREATTRRARRADRTRRRVGADAEEMSARAKTPLEATIERYHEAKRKVAEGVLKAKEIGAQELAKAQNAVKNAPAPVMMQKFVDGTGFVDREAYPVFVERMAVGSVIFSKSYWGDAWLYLKNNHLLLAVFLAHPKHPFSRMERLICLFCSFLVGFGLTCLFNLITKEPTKTVVSVLVGGLIQGIYDALLRLFAECLCVQSCPSCIVRCFEACGKIGMLVQFFLGCMVLVIGIVAFLRAEQRETLIGVTWRFALSKAASWIVASLLFCLIGYHFARRSQMRPGSSRRTFSEKEEHDRWNTAEAHWCCCFSCLMPRRAPSYFWNYYIGEDVTFDELPDRPPKYKAKCFCGASEPAPTTSTSRPTGTRFGQP